MNKKTIKRKHRLNEAKLWIPTYTGKHLLRGYKKHFKLSTIEAITDLEQLGYFFTEEYLNYLRLNVKRPLLYENPESNDYLYFIAGYTENGVPYGISWEEAERLKLMDGQDHLNNKIDEDLPF